MRSDVTDWSNAGTPTSGVVSAGTVARTGTATVSDGTVTAGMFTGTTGSGMPGTTTGVPAGMQVTNAHTWVGVTTPVLTGEVGPTVTVRPGTVCPPTGMMTPPISC